MRLHGEPWLRVVAGAVGAGAAIVLAAHIAGRVYQDPTIWALAGWAVTPDFEVFYGAAQDVTAGRTPYEDFTPPAAPGYVYPPLLAFLLSPVTVLPVDIAASLWALLSLFFVVGALYVLDVRDWRCYPVALLWPFNREAMEYGAIGPLLLLVVAICWRYRDHPWGASASAGCAVALKLFLWPLVLWLAFTGRVKSAGLAVASTAVLIFVPWAVIGFQGLAQFPALLRKASEQQDGTYSLVALARALGFSVELADAISLTCGLGLLILAFLAAHGRGSAGVRDRRSLTFVIAASLVLTPIVWTHYFVLLLAPVALARPRLALVWLVPLFGTVLYTFDWYRASPEGELLPLIAVTTLVTFVFAACLWTRAPGGRDLDEAEGRRVVRRADGKPAEVGRLSSPVASRLVLRAS